MSDKELQKTLKKAITAANHGIATILKGGNVISSCKAGLNRSGLISGLIIMKLAEYPANDTVRLIRRRRSPYALFNPLFVYQLKKLDPLNGY
jgi:protein-tyrosine phosphatase